MKIFCPRWGFENIPWPAFLKQVKEANYAGIEWFPFAKEESYDEVLALLAQHDLEFAIVMAVTEPYSNFDRYIVKLQEDLGGLMKIRNESIAPLFFSAQVGREFFDEQQIEACLSICNLFEEKYKTPIYQETHRNKWSYAAHVVAPVLAKNSKLKLTFDISHWFCVSESYLEDQQEAVKSAITHAKHIHARVGSRQASQVWDPADAEYEEDLHEHLKVWDAWITHMRATNLPITITPEFGPEPYFVKGSRTTSLTDEQWRINLWMKTLLQNRYQ